MKSTPVLQKKPNKEKRGRPITRAGAYDKVTAIRLSPEFRQLIDDWAACQEDKPERSEAIRRLVQLGLAARPPAPHRAAVAHAASQVDGTKTAPAKKPRARGP
jgi:hypothetical protein